MAGDRDGWRTLLITGTVGVGKTSVAERVTWLLAEAEVAHAAVDLDEIRRSWPAPPDDPFNLDVELRNLAALAEIYASVGATHLVLAGVVESRRGRARYEDVVGAELTVCRLRAEPDELRRRLHVRHADDPDGLRWHLDRAPELDRILDDAGVADFVVATAGRDQATLAAEVLDRAGWR